MRSAAKRAERQRHSEPESALAAGRLSSLPPWFHKTPLEELHLLASRLQRLTEQMKELREAIDGDSPSPE